MELNEATHRIVLQHWRVIALAVVVLAAAGAIIGSTSGGYKASTRLVISSQDPQAQAQATAIADTARAIVTSPSIVRKALAAAGAPSNRDPVAFAAHDISVSALGSSGVLALTVTDKSAIVAAATSNALARALIKTRLEIANGRLDATRAGLDSRIASLNRRLAQLDVTIASLTRRIAAAPRSRSNALKAQLGDSSTQRGFLTQQRGLLESAEASLFSTASAGPNPTIVSAATASDASAVGSSYLPDAVLGALLGLILGVGIAAALEGLRPTLAGGEAVARELGTPHLGGFAAAAAGEQGLLNGGAEAALRLTEAVKQAGVSNVDLLGAGSSVDLGLIAELLNSAVPNGAYPHDNNGAFGIRPFGPQDVAEGRNTGLVVISPEVLKRNDLVRVAQFIRATPWPLLGVITYKPTQHWWNGLLLDRHAVASGEALSQG